MNNEQNQQKQNQQKQKSPNRGNFKNDPQRAAEAGRKGGRASHGGGRRPAE